MASKIFVDTNVLLRFFLRELANHRECRTLLRKLIREGVELCISGQVIREFYVRALHPRTFAEVTVTERTLPPETEWVLRIVESLPDFFRIVDQPHAVHEMLSHLLREYQVRGTLTHDTNILATMLVHGFDTICSLDSDFERFSNRVTILRPEAGDAHKGTDPA